MLSYMTSCLFNNIYFIYLFIYFYLFIYLMDPLHYINLGTAIMGWVYKHSLFIEFYDGA